MHPTLGRAPRPWWWDCCFAACAFSSSLRGLKLVPAKWRCLVPGERRDGAQSHPAGSSLSRSPVPRRSMRGITQTGTATTCVTHPNDQKLLNLAVFSMISACKKCNGCYCSCHKALGAYAEVPIHSDRRYSPLGRGVFRDGEIC